MKVLLQNLHKFFNENLLQNQLVKSLDYVLQKIKLDDLKNLLVFKSVSGKLVMTSVTSVVTELGQ